MEENSDSQMETDVSSTTQDIPPPQEVSGPSSSMEVTVEVAETNAEDEEMKAEEQDERIDSNTPEKALLTQVMEPKVPVKIIVIKKAKTPTKPIDLERSLLKKEAMLSPTKVSLVKTAQASDSDSQVQTPVKKSPEKPTVSTKLLDKPVNVQKSPIKHQQTTGNDILPPKTPEKASPVQKSPTKPVETLTKSVEEPAEKTVTEEKMHATEVQTPPKAPETEKVIDSVEAQDIEKKDVPEKPTIAEQPIAKPDKEAETPSKGEVTVTVSVEPHDEKEISDDSHTESISSAGNKSISRELRSLINSAKESKIISECTQLKTKTRKSRSLLDNSNTALNTSADPEKIQSSRRESCNSQESSSSEKSEKVPQQRVLGLRHQNADPNVPKSKGMNKTAKEDENLSESEKTDSLGFKKANVTLDNDPTKSTKLRSDPYCWRCHYGVELAPNEKVHLPARCTVCPRAFHYRCLSGPERTKLDKETNWVCPKCMTILHAESSETRSPVMKNVTLGMLCDLLKYALKRMMEINGVDPFLNPVDRAAFPDYEKYVVHAVDLSLIKENINAGVYGSTEAFASDVQWILHNSIIFNTPQSKLTAAAKALVRSCRTEMGEIEACPECYAAAHARRPTWFTDVCSNPHVLLWAKLKGFPYWPAKGMSVNSAGMVDARFFGAHDRAWVPARDCFLYSERDPNAFRTKRQDIIDSMREAEQHIRNISRKFGKFIYPAFKVQFEPSKINEQIKMMIPGYEPEEPAPRPKPGTPSPAPKGRSGSKSSKDSFADGAMSDEELPTAEKKRKTDEFVEIEVPSLRQTAETVTSKAAAKKLEDKKEESIESADVLVKEASEKRKQTETPKDVSRKRRRSALEEATLTIMKQKETPKEIPKKRRRSALEEATLTIMMPEPAKRQKTATANTPDKSKLKAAENKGENTAKETTEAVKTYSKTGTSSPKPFQVEALKETMEKSETASPRTTRASTPASASKQANKQTPKVNTPKEADKVKKAKAAQREKSTSSEIEKEDKSKPKRDRTSKGNNSQNSTPKSAIKKTDRESSSSTNESDTNKDKNPPLAAKPKGKSLKDNILFDEDNTSLAVLSKKNFEPQLPTISNVRSLSQTDLAKVTEITKANSNSSIFTPTSTDNVNNMKEAVAKLQKLRETEQPIVGRVGVRSFARMTSPPAQRDASDNDQVEVEVKAEPIDLDDADRQSEKIDFANTIRLRPVNPQSVPSLRDIRITKVVATSASTTSNTSIAVRKQIVVHPNDIRPKARKTFPQPQKASDGRAELNSKNSMVYIPIQPPKSQAPVRPPVRIHTSVIGPGTPPLLRPQITVGSTSANNIVNTVTTPLMTVVTMSNSSPMPTLSQVTSVAQMGQMGSLTPLGAMGQVPQVGQVPTTVHTVPLITSVNGQWTFSLQPMMSVGGVDRAPSPPLSNGMPEPLAQLSPLVSISSPASTNVPPLASIAPKTSDTTPAELPRLQQKPTACHPLDPKAPMGEVPTPSAAGPITAKINQNAAKLTDFFRSLLEDSLEYLDHPTFLLTNLKKEMERLQWRHKQQIDEIKHNHELQLAEMRSMLAAERVRVINDTRRNMQVELNNAVKHAKSRQWCAYCQLEAQFYCCWNTSYCDYPCQRAHWAQHFSVCTQQRTQDKGNTLDLTEDRLQASDNPPALQKPAVGATVTVGGKVIQSRLMCQNSPNQGGKPAIIVSMVEDTCGNTTVKCVGTFKPTTPQTTQSTPLLINKQIMNSEENSAKKVVTSGGYLIVGAANASSPSVAIN